MTELNGKRIVVVEDDYLLASDICRELRDLGATVLGPAPTPFYALQLIGGKRVDVAILDTRLHGATVLEVADRLREQGVPIVFLTEMAEETLPQRFDQAPLLPKPLDRERLLITLYDLIRRPLVRTEPTQQLKPLPPSREPPVVVFARALMRGLIRGRQR